MDLSNLSVPVLALIRYMVDIADSTVTPIETQLRVALTTKRAA
jgi:hypothetical protein